MPYPHHWEDMSRIMYSGYFGAMSAKQQGSGVCTVKDFFNQWKRNSEIIIGYFNESSNDFMEILLTVDSLAASPFGIGGSKILKEKYGYERKDLRLKIAKEINLSKPVIDVLEGEFYNDIINAIRIFNAYNVLPLYQFDVFTKELAEDIYNVLIKKDSNLESTIQGLLQESPERQERIDNQEKDICFVIEKLESNGVPGGGDALMYLLATKESDFAKRRI